MRTRGWILGVVTAWVTACVTLVAAGCSDDGGSEDGGTVANATAGDSTTAAADGSGDAPMTTAAMSSEEGSTAAADTTAADTAATTDSTGAVATDSTGAAEFILTSPAFEEGGVIPGAQHINGGNIHPQLDWVGAPAGTMSFGVFFHDVTISFDHSAIWNISADATGLPEDVEHAAMPGNVPGAVQCQNWAGGTGYGGPGSSMNFYQFTLYALDVADLGGEVDASSSRMQVRAALEAHSIGEATLSGQTNGPNG